MIFAAAFWPAALFVLLYSIIPSKTLFLEFIGKWVGRNTYGIFLWQIVFFGLFSFSTTYYSSFLDLLMPGNLLIILAVLAICIIPGIIIETISRKIIREILG